MSDSIHVKDDSKGRDISFFHWSEVCGTWQGDAPSYLPSQRTSTLGHWGEEAKLAPSGWLHNQDDIPMGSPLSTKRIWDFEQLGMWSTPLLQAKPPFMDSAGLMPTEARGSHLPEPPYLRETKTYHSQPLESTRHAGNYFVPLSVRPIFIYFL